MKKSILKFLLLLFCGLSFCQSSRRILEVKKPRMNGADVESIQNKLVQLGFNEVGEADGYYGPMSAAAVKSLQQVIGISESGIVDDAVYDFFDSADFKLLEPALKVYNKNKNEQNCVHSEEYVSEDYNPFSPMIYVFKTGKNTAYCMYEESYDFYGLEVKFFKADKNTIYVLEKETHAENPTGEALNPWDENPSYSFVSTFTPFIIVNGVLYEIKNGSLQKAESDEYLKIAARCKKWLK